MISLQQDDNVDVIEVGDKIRSLSTGNEATIISFTEFLGQYIIEGGYAIQQAPQHVCLLPL